MTYVSLYRKYRSQTFEDVMGQEHVTKTLQNAIRLGKVAHAYLFCGTRGTGKTTTARLLAKALNCEKGPTPQPCNECPSCISVTAGNAMDIMEMDAASHRSIRDIEDIRENVKFPPMELRYKVFIIDEAHQLSGDAKDAFLKTLEEPPAHAVFILATTEPQSIPLTIRSRCQQFDFRRGSLRDIRERLKFVADGEKFKIDDAALDLISVSADGSWRDGLSLLEQVLAYTDGKITADDVNAVLGTVTQDFLFKLADTLADGDECGAFEAAAEAVESGRDIQQLLKSAAQHFRNLLFMLVTKNSGNMTTSEELATRMRDQAAKFSRQSLLRIVEIFSEGEREARFSDQHRLILELALLKAIETTRPVESVPTPAPKPAPAESAPQQKAPQPKQEPAPKAEIPTKPVEEPTPAAPIKSQQNLPEFDKIKEQWNVVLQHIKSIDKLSHGLLSEIVPVDVRNGALVLQFKYVAHVKLIDEDKSSRNTKRNTLLTAIERVFGVPNAKIICEVKKAQEKALAPAAPSQNDDLPNPFKDSGEDTFKNVLDIFPDSSIVDE